jgi:hypothetical protein
MNQSQFKVTKNINDGFVLCLNEQKVKNWKQKRGLVDYVYTNYGSHLKRDTVLKIINESKEDNGVFQLPVETDIFSQKDMDDLVLLKIQVVPLENENAALKKELVTLKESLNTTPVIPVVKESGRGWMSDESDEEEEEEGKEDFIEVVPEDTRKPFSPSFIAGDLIQHLENLYPPEILEKPDKIDGVIKNKETIIKEREKHFFPDGDAQNAEKIKLTDECFCGSIELIKCTTKDALHGIILNNNLEKYGFYREWLDDNIDGEYKNDDEVVLDPTQMMN